MIELNDEKATRMVQTLCDVIAEECKRHGTDLDVRRGYVNTSSVECFLTRHEMLPTQVCAAVKRRTGARDYDSGVGKVTFYYR